MIAGIVVRNGGDEANVVERVNARAGLILV